MTRPRPAAWIAKLLIALIAAALLACSGDDGSSSIAGLLPDGFPVPDDAQVLNSPGDGKGVVTLGVPGPGEEVLAFYERTLPSQDWTLDPWTGTDPFGKPTGGFIMERGTQTAALSVTEATDGLVHVQLNFHQPTQPKPGEGHGGGPAPTEGSHG
jgi:hypothetical protein